MTSDLITQCRFCLQAIRRPPDNPHHILGQFFRTCTGSSPRVWGTPPLPIRLAAVARFIPACVGNATSRKKADDQRPVHPRVCGERSLGVYSSLMRSGSSPRVWGTRASSIVRQRVQGFIPACVGNAYCIRWTYGGTTVHPRVCGERRPDGSSIGLADGSSPRVWGTQLQSK